MHFFIARKAMVILLLKHQSTVNLLINLVININPMIILLINKVEKGVKIGLTWFV